MERGPEEPEGGGGGQTTQTQTGTTTTTGGGGSSGDRPSHKGRSCKGTLYYSSVRNSRRKDPLCWGFSKSLPQVNSKLIKQSEAEARNKGNQLKDFKFICVGYSMYLNNKNKTQEESDDQVVNLPFCVGIEILADRRPNPNYIPDHARKEATANDPPPQPQSKKRFNTPMEFLERFQKCSGLVAAGVANNMGKVGSYVKESIDDILYPYRKRPK